MKSNFKETMAFFLILFSSFTKDVINTIFCYEGVRRLQRRVVLLKTILIVIYVKCSGLNIQAVYLTIRVIYYLLHWG